MNFNKLVEATSSTFNKAVFATKKKSPEIFLVLGFVSLGAGIVYACKKSMELPKVMEIKDEHLAKLDVVEENDEGIITAEPDTKQVAKVYFETGLEVVKMYAVPFALIATGTGFILASHGEMSRRNAALSAAYTSVSSAFDVYRQRLMDKYGKEADNELRFGIKEKTVITEVSDENGEVKTVEKKTLVVDKPDESQWARYFTSSNLNWNNDDDYNRMFLNRIQRYVNDAVRSRKYIFMNDIYAALGVKQCKMGQKMGYLYKKDASGRETNIEFNVKRVQIPASSNPDDGYVNVLLIDFTTPVDVFANLDDEDYVGD